MVEASNRKPLSGEVVCITGGFSCYYRRDLARIIRDLGGEFTEEFTSRTTMLVRGHLPKDRDSGKFIKAKGKGIPILSESEFCEKCGLNYQPRLGFCEAWP